MKTISQSLVLVQNSVDALAINDNNVGIPFLTAGLTDQTLNLVFKTTNPIPISGELRVTSFDDLPM